MKVHFLGAIDTVTGSKYLLEFDSHKVLLDCGLYQGLKPFRLRNWEPFVKASDIDAVVLTHAHLDHSGYLPALMEQGFKGPIFATEATRALCEVLLPDAGFLQEEDARFANKHKFSKHDPALPLFTQAQARRVLEQFVAVPFGVHTPIANTGGSVSFSGAGHILGAASVQFNYRGRKLVFSGDLGRYDDAIMYDPEPAPDADVLIVESTYGDKRHESLNIEEVLADTISQTVKRGGSVLIPAFAVGRAQLILYYLLKLKRQRQVPDIPVFLNSPMAIKATEVYKQFKALHRLTAEDCRAIDQMTHYVQSVEESMALNASAYPSVIISASGMATGGRVLHHLKSMLGDVRNSVLFVGYQAVGTRGEKLIQGASEIKIHGYNYPVRASIVNLGSLSAHGDYAELMRWLKTSQRAPEQVYVTHGEQVAAASLCERIREELGWEAQLPELSQIITL